MNVNKISWGDYLNPLSDVESSETIDDGTHGSLFEDIKRLSQTASISDQQRNKDPYFDFFGTQNDGPPSSSNASPPPDNFLAP